MTELINRRTFNKQQSEYVNEINNENIIRLQTYHNHAFDKYYFDRNNQKLYLHQPRNNRYKVIKPTRSGRYLIVALIPSDQRQPITCGYNKLIRHLMTL